MSVSNASDGGPSAPSARRAHSSVRLESSATDIIEIAALRGRTDDVEVIARRLGLDLPEFGRVSLGSNHMSLSVRPNRWLLLSPPATPGEAVSRWAKRCTDCASVVDLSSALTVYELSSHSSDRATMRDDAGAAVRELLARGCRLDLDPAAFPEHHAAATIMAQVSVTLANLGSAFLLLTPATTARHFSEWLRATGRPFGPEA